MSSSSSVNSNNLRAAGGNNGGGSDVVTRAEFNQLQENIRVIMERLEVRDRRSHSDASHRRRSGNGSETDSVKSRRRGDRDERKKGLENIKLKIPAFTGSSKPEEFLDWIPRVEKVFDCYEWDERMKVKMASLAFSDYVSLW